MLWSDEDQNQALGINSTRRVWRRRNAAYDPIDHLLHHQTWRWKHYALGCFSAKEDRTTGPQQRDDGRGHVPSGPGH